jgi:Putative peptidoglycan binding domain
MTCVIGVVLFATAVLALQTTPPAKTKRAKTTQVKPAAGSAKTSGKSSSRAGTHRRYAKRAPAPSYQTHPDPQRYQEIQKALADRGYFKGEVNGQWGDDSVDALKRFQADQKLDNDGKINSLTLMGLGLGPKHDGSTAGSASAVAPSTTAPASSVPEADAPPH